MFVLIIGEDLSRVVSLDFNNGLEACADNVNIWGEQRLMPVEHDQTVNLAKVGTKSMQNLPLTMQANLNSQIFCYRFDGQATF
jgi:hypothetical protein